MRNIEIKAKVKNLSYLLSQAKLLSNSEGTVIPQHDTFYKTPAGRLKLRKYEDGIGKLIYYERPDSEGPKMSSYDICEVPSSSSNDLHTVLQRALGITGVVKKTRHLFMVGQTRVHVDDVEGLGDYMELEVVLNPEQSEEEGEEIAHCLMEKLGIKKEDLLAGAYTDMLKK